MINLCVVGDDLTGTADCTSLGVLCGCEVRIESDAEKKFAPPDPGKREVLGICISSRTLPGKKAYELSRRITEKVKSEKSQIILKKMDTGFRGNAAFEIEGMLDALGKNLCFILEHVPVRKTFTLYGHQYAAGQILNKSVYARDDRLKAPTESYIPTILAKDTDLPIGTVNIDDVKGGNLLAAVKREVNSGKKILVFDVITFEDGMRIVNELQPVYPEVMWAGSTGIVENLLVYLYGPMKHAGRKAQKPRCVCFSGTAYEATAEQIKVAQEETDLKVLDLDVRRVLAEDRSIFDEIEEDALAAVSKGKNVLVRQRVFGESEREGLDRVILQGLCECARRICGKVPFDRLVVIGGETSQALFSSLGITTLEMEEPPEVGCGVGIITDGPYKGKKFAIKGGSTGSNQVLLKLMDCIDW